MMWLVLGLLACTTGRGAENASTRAALEAWRDGVEALEQDDAEGARIAFQDARRHQPKDALLLGWEAVARARLGELAEAVELLDRALLLDPGLGTARYNRAAYLARMGKPDLAGPELELALSAGVATRRGAAADPDFEPYLGHEAFGFLPRTVLTSLGAEGPEGPVFAGSDFRVVVRIAGAGERVVGVTAQRLQGPAELSGAEETLLDSTDGLVRELVWTWRALGPGKVVIGPLDARVGDRVATIERIEVEVLATPGTETPVIVHDGGLPTPLEYGTGEIPRARTLGVDLVVVAELGDRLEIDPKPTTRPQILVYSDRDVPRFRAYRWIGEGQTTRRIRIIRNGTEVLDEKVGAAP